MKISKRQMLFLVSLFAIFIVSAASFLKNADDSNPSLGIQLYRLEDGTTLVVNSRSGFDFSIPAGWYPVLIPASSEELEKFDALTRQNNLPLDKNWVLQHTFDPMPLIAVDLNSTNYKNDSNIPMLFAYTDVTAFSPSGLIIPVINLLKSSGRVTEAYVTTDSEQEVGFVEFKSLVDETPFLGGKLLMFIRDQYLFVIAAQTDTQEILLPIKLTIDDIGASLHFYAAK